MIEFIKGLKAGFEASSDIDKVRNPPDKVQELVALMEKHHAADKVMGSFQKAVRKIVAELTTGRAAEFYRPTSNSAHAEIVLMQELMTMGKRGQEAVLDFCEKHGKYEDAFRLIQDNFSRNQSPEKDIHGLAGSAVLRQTAKTDFGFPNFVEQVILGRDRRDPPVGLPSVNDREFENDTLRKSVRMSSIFGIQGVEEHKNYQRVAPPPQ